MSRAETDPETSSRPRRMTREERRADTRARLLAAAAETFAEKGFHGATVEEITNRAGFTRGAFYSNFTDKDDLFLGLVDERLASDTAEIGARLNDADPRKVVATLRGLGAERPPDEAWAMLATEFWLYAMRNPDVRPRLAERQRAERLAYARAIEAQFEPLGLPVPALDLLALIVQVLDHGAFREHRIDPEGVPEGAFFDALALLSETAVELAKRQRRESSSRGRR